jgi:hypothetical protein
MHAVNHSGGPAFTSMVRTPAGDGNGLMARGQPVVDSLNSWRGGWAPRGLVFPRATHAAAPSLDPQKQRDEFALAMCVGLGKDRFQLIARRLP